MEQEVDGETGEIISGTNMCTDELPASMSLSLRPYQQRIVTTILQKNTIVLLPTGAGKTLIAAECAKLIPGNMLFLVPTCLLVEQQATAIRAWTGQRVAEYMGGAKLQQPFDILVSTPDAFRTAQSNETNPSLSWENFGLVVFDEVHHVLKHHPYRSIAMSLRRSEKSPRIVGLSASLTYEVEASAMETQIRKLWNELNIEDVATADVAELQLSGYHATHVPMEVRIPVLGVPVGLIPRALRMPHKMHELFFDRIRDGSSTAFAAALMTVIRALEDACKSTVPTFTSPLVKISLKDWGPYAHALATQSPLCGELEHWYEALRLFVVSWEEAEDAATMFLRMTVLDHPTSMAAVPWPPPAADARTHFALHIKPSFPRFEHLKDCLRYKLDTVESFRGIVFVQQRVSTHILEYVISSDPHLSPLLRPASIYAAGSPATASLAVSKTIVASRVGAFSRGEVNLLLATVVAEEGMDVAAANCVIRFDAMIHAVSLVQGRGRGEGWVMFAACYWYIFYTVVYCLLPSVYCLTVIGSSFSCHFHRIFMPFPWHRSAASGLQLHRALRAIRPARRQARRGGTYAAPTGKNTPADRPR